LSQLPLWVAKTQGELQETTINITEIRYGIDSYKSTANYILKGVESEHAERFYLKDLQDEKGPQGIIYGKRAGFSQSIGVTAQKRAKFNPTKYRTKRRWGKKK